jgi:hypothetical protein
MKGPPKNGGRRGPTPRRSARYHYQLTLDFTATDESDLDNPLIWISRARLVLERGKRRGSLADTLSAKAELRGTA